MPVFPLPAHPEARSAVWELELLTDPIIDGIASSCILFDVPVRFTPGRADFVTRALKTRDALFAVVGG